MERQWATATRHDLPLALAILDLDDFKQINDTRGHAVGDRLLRHGRDDHARPTCAARDRAFRIGGDEFAIIMPGTDAERAHVVVRRLLAACLDGEVDGSDAMAISFSAGISAIPGPRARPRLALRPGRRGPVVGQAPRPDVRDDLRRGTPRPADHRAPAGGAVRTGRPGRRDRRGPGGLPADLRPDHRRAARVRGPRPAAARQRLRRRRLDVRGRRGDRPDRRARPRLPQHGHGDRRAPAPARDRSRSTCRRGRWRWTTSASTPCCG